MEIELVVSAACQFGLPEPIQILYSTYMLLHLVCRTFSDPIPSYFSLQMFTQFTHHTRTYKNHIPEMSQAVAPQLRPYQLAGFRWMACLCKNGLGAVLADDMGLGKTLQCISVLLYLKDGMGDVGASWCP